MAGQLIDFAQRWAPPGPAPTRPGPATSVRSGRPGDILGSGPAPGVARPAGEDRR